MLKKYIGNKQFYKTVLALTIPIMIQNGITYFVSMLDNIMVGRVGTVQMTGVAVTNQLILVFNLCIFGAVSGAGIFGAQFFGKRDNKGVRDIFRLKILFCMLLTVIGILIFIFLGKPLISLYLKGDGSAKAAAESFKYAREYMMIMLIGLIPYALAQCYSSTLRECSESVLPMIAGIIAVGVNLIFNYILIFGNLGAPRLGVNGAAIATVISRFVELFVVAFGTYRKRDNNEFIIGAFKSFKIPLFLIKRVSLKGLPLMLNETMWAAGMAMLNQCYSTRGLDVVAANNICQTFFNVFSVSFIAVGVAIGIVLGQTLGSGDTKKIMDTSAKLIAFSLFVSIIVSAVYFMCAGIIPKMYNTNADVKLTAEGLMRICALTMPIDAFANAAYFTIRSGGKTGVTFIFDSGFVWVVCVPVAFVLSRFTSLGILTLYAICQCVNIIKCLIGYIFVKRGSWIKNIVD